MKLNYMEEIIGILMEGGVLLLIFAVLAVQGWITSSKKIRENRHEQIVFDTSFTVFLTIPALLITVITNWVRNGFVTTLVLLGIIIVAFFVAKLLGYLLGITRGYYGLSVIIQLILLVTSIVLLMIAVF